MTTVKVVCELCGKKYPTQYNIKITKNPKVLESKWCHKCTKKEMQPYREQVLAFIARLERVLPKLPREIDNE
jgi:ribosome-binding protein aMBF1 (putative translation factor)